MKKLIAGFMTALMALLPLVSAAELGNYPAFLEAADGTLDALVVIGSAAAVGDVVGAVDLAVRLAETGGADVTQECPGAAGAVDGIMEDKIDLPSSAAGTPLSDSSAFPASGVLKTFHYSGLRDSYISWKGDDYDFHEEANVGSAAFRHDGTDSKINGTETLVIKSGDIYYDYVFDEDLNLSTATSAGTTGTINNPEYSYPINIELLGMPFVIVGLGVDQVKMLSGSIGTATATIPVTHGDYSVYADLGSDGSWSRVIIKDADGNTVDTLTISQGDSKQSTATGLTIQVTAVRALQDGTVVGADLVVGPTAEGVTKVYDASADVTSTGTASDRFPGETNWGIQVKGVTAGLITKTDYVRVVYKPTTKQYLKAGEKLALPNDYGDLGFEGWNTDLFATLTVEVVSGMAAYDKDAETTSYGNLNGLKLSADVSGTILSPSGNAFTVAYILFNASQATGDSYPVMIGYYDESKTKTLVDPDAAADAEYAAEVMTLAGNETLDYNFTLNYGSVGDSTYYVKFTVGTAENNSKIINNFQVGTKIVGNFLNRTVWTSSDAPEFRLGTTDSAQDTDVVITSGGADINAGKYTQEVVGDQGLLLQNPESYSASNQVVVKIPAKDLKIKAYFGKLGEGVTGDVVSYTSYPSVPITSAVARLDTELTDADKAKNLVSVGGPAVNRVSADALGVDYPSYGAASTIPEDKGLIKVVDSPYTTGMVVLVVAGWEVDNTRAACSAVQLYDTKLAGITASAVEVTGTVGAPTVTAV